MPDWIKTPGDVKDLVTAIAIVAGGVWTFYQFVLRRAFESALKIAAEAVVSPGQDDQHLVTIRVTLENTGPRRIYAAVELSPELIEDFEHSVVHPGDLQIKRIEPGVSPAFIGWWTNRMSRLPGIPEHVSLLFEYSRRDGRNDFFMEPGESYTLETIFRLPPASYAAKIVFVGKRAGAHEFWSRIFHFEVPARVG